MPLFAQRDAADALTDLLEREHRALKEGDMARLARLAEAKERLLETLIRGGSAARLGPLRDMLARNQRLLQAAAAGIRDAADLVARARDRAQGDLQTYRADGSRTPKRARPSITRRA